MYARGAVVPLHVNEGEGGGSGAARARLGRGLRATRARACCNIPLPASWAARIMTLTQELHCTLNCL